ncbi:hypothetical protein PM082_020326 [Marasmius tenuissimus]|nr:hypothetical protein PM082_020326 [Marasmius tenuissimus]
MGVHFHDKSPSDPNEQRNHLRAPAELVKSGLPFVVYAETALSIIHRVLTVLFDLQLLLYSEDLWRAQKAICRTLPYTCKEYDEENTWNDYRMVNKDAPYAFSLNEDTLLLVHNNPEEARLKASIILRS